MMKLFETVNVDDKMAWTKCYIETHLDLDEDTKQSLYLAALETDIPDPDCEDLSIPKAFLYRIFDDLIKTKKEKEVRREEMPAGIFMNDAEIVRDLRGAQLLFDRLFDMLF